MPRPREPWWCCTFCGQTARKAWLRDRHMQSARCSELDNGQGRKFVLATPEVAVAAERASNGAHRDVEKAEAVQKQAIAHARAASRFDLLPASEAPPPPVVAVADVDTVDDDVGVGATNTRDLTLTDGGDAYTIGSFRIRKTTHVPPKVSVHDLVAAVCCDNKPDSARKTFGQLLQKHPDLVKIFPEENKYQFPGKGSRTPVTDAEGVVLLLNVLPGRSAEQFRLQCAKTMVRFMGGDETLIPEIQQMAQLQHTLPADNPMRLFGDAVAATNSSAVAEPSAPHPDIAGFIRAPGTIIPLPPRKPGMYFCLVLPSASKLVMDDPVPPNMVIVGFGYSGASVYDRVVQQDRLYGHFEFMHCILTQHALELEGEFKNLLKVQKHCTPTVKGKLVKTGENKIEFFLATYQQYITLLDMAREMAQQLESRSVGADAEVALNAMSAFIEHNWRAKQQKKIFEAPPSHAPGNAGIHELFSIHLELRGQAGDVAPDVLGTHMR